MKFVTENIFTNQKQFKKQSIKNLFMPIRIAVSELKCMDQITRHHFSYSDVKKSVQHIDDMLGKNLK